MQPFSSELLWLFFCSAEQLNIFTLVKKIKTEYSVPVYAS